MLWNRNQIYEKNPIKINGQSVENVKIYMYKKGGFSVNVINIICMCVYVNILNFFSIYKPITIINETACRVNQN
jgi:hypothetical protein